MYVSETKYKFLQLLGYMSIYSLSFIDFNARVGDCIDYIDKEDEPYLPLLHNGNHEFILPRVSCDSKTINQYGKGLIYVRTTRFIL